MLLRVDADVSHTNKSGVAALDIAVGRSDPEVVRALLSNGAEATRATALAIAAMFGNYESAEALLDAGVRATALIPYGRNALMLAALFGRRNMVDLLVRRDADLNTADNFGTTPLMFAARGGHLEVVQRLLNHGAHVNTIAKDGNTAISIAAARGYVDTVKMLLNSGADTVNAERKTVLMIAVEGGHLELVENLLDRNINVNAADDSGWTALHGAASSGSPKLVRLLLDAGARADVLDEYFGATPLVFAARLGHTDVLKVMLEKDVDVDQRDRDGNTALMMATLWLKPQSVKVLLDAGADANAEKIEPHFLTGEEHAFTALWFAVSDGNLEITRMLLDAGANPNHVGTNNQSVAMLAQLEGHTEISRLLRLHGAVR